MNLSITAQAILLLTSYFSKPAKDDVKPLAISEWARFTLWLKNNEYTPADLLNENAHEIINKWHDKKIPEQRIQALLQRGHSLALAYEKWSRAGLWVLTRSDAAYPQRLKQQLKNEAPPVLFGCGNQALLNNGGIAVVGSRHVDEQDLLFTKELAKKAVAANIGIVSGGAKGVDETAMLAASQEGGQVIGVMADSLLKSATATKWRNAIMQENMVLISPFYPEAGFNTGNAMSRNKYIYCLADTAFVVHSGTTGGTWTGAIENLKKGWVSLWVKKNNNKDSGNNELINKGGVCYAEKSNDINIVKLVENNFKETTVMDDLFGSSQIEKSSANKNNNLDKQASTYNRNSSRKHVDFYQLFLSELEHLGQKPISATEIASELNLKKTQVEDWLRVAVESDLAKKLSKPVRYQWNAD